MRLETTARWELIASLPVLFSVSHTNYRLILLIFFLPRIILLNPLDP
jgi:hypothetical protein